MIRTIISWKIIFPAVIVAVVYLLVISYSMNYSLVKDAVVSNHTFSYRAIILTSMVIGMFNSMTTINILVLLATSMLSGLNIALIIQRLSMMRLSGLHALVGGSSFFGLATSGCASCGLPIFAMMGISGSILYLPLRGLELSFISAAILGTTLYMQLKSYEKESCEIKR